MTTSTFTPGTYTAPNGKTYEVPDYARPYTNDDGITRITGLLVKDGRTTRFSTNLRVDTLTPA